MKIQKIILPLLLGTVLLACSPRVDDVFEDTAVVRLEQRRTDIMKRLMGAENGWVMQYFAQSDPTSSDSVKHRGYTFVMEFHNDGTVTVGAPVNGVYKTETSMWDIINDNSTVLTFNTFNSIFHYYSNPDPELGLWNTDGEGVGGDYEFTVLDYEQEGYQLLKGKKRSQYIRLYPLQAGREWESVFESINRMDQRLFGENASLDFYFGDSTHYTFYNCASHEFRAFKFGADTLGGGSYYGFIVTEKGIRFNDLEVLEAPVNRAGFNLSEDGQRLVSQNRADAYITIDAANLFLTSEGAWKAAENTLPENLQQAVDKVTNEIASLQTGAAITGFGWQLVDDTHIELLVYYTLGSAALNYDAYEFEAAYGRHSVTLTATGKYATRSQLHQFGALDFVPLFNGTYDLALTQPFAPSKGITATRRGGDIILKMAH